jgi:hypothetical protein
MLAAAAAATTTTTGELKYFCGQIVEKPATT